MIMLVADDEYVIRSGLISLDWKSIGITEVYSAANGEEARKILFSNPIDIVICDIRMPGLSGIELSSLIKKHSMDTAVILLTGFSEFEYARAAIRNGVYEYLLKPFRPREILETVQNVKEKLENKRFQAKVIRMYEDTTGSMDTLSQVKNCFPKTSTLVSKILVDMSEHFDQPLSLGEYAEKNHFTKNYISKLIKKDTDYSFGDLLTAIRLMNAAMLLLEDEKVNQACEKCGFNDQRYFSQVFKRAFDCSPSELKKQGMEQRDIRLKTILDKMNRKAGI